MATGQNIADEARGDLNDGDAANYRWSDAEILRFINAAQRQIVFLLPEANVVEEEMDLVVGARQALPANGVKFMGLYNVETVGEESVRGLAVTVIEEDSFDSALPSWMIAALQPDEVDGPIEHVIHDPRDPKTFSVYPAPQTDATVGVFVKHAKIPTALGSLASTFGLGDEYINGAVEYTKFRMLTKDGRYGTEPGVRLELWNNFRTALGLKPQTDMRVDPSRERAGGDANG